MKEEKILTTKEILIQSAVAAFLFIFLMALFDYFVSKEYPFNRYAAIRGGIYFIGIFLMYLYSNNKKKKKLENNG